MPPLRPTTDGVVTIRPAEPGDAALLVAGRDEVSRRWLGEGTPEPDPTGCIVVDGEVVGWVDYDVDRTWLLPGEVNLGYNVFAPNRGKGYASRAVQLLMHHLAIGTDHRTATLLIAPGNERSLALAARTRFVPSGDLDGNPYFKRPVPPLTYTDGRVTIRSLRDFDLDAHLEAADDEQIDWLWLPGQRESWEAMTPEAQRAHARRHLLASEQAFGTGPKWVFGVDATDADYVAYIDCDLANAHVPRGSANISYASHPAHRGRGYVSAAVRLLAQFLRDHTGAREAHILVDAENVASLRVTRSVGAATGEPEPADGGRTRVRHVLTL